MQAIKNLGILFLLCGLIIAQQTLVGMARSKSYAAKTSSQTPTQRDGQHDFDFEIGTWKTHVKRLLHPLAGSTDWVEYDGITVVRPVWQGRANLVELKMDGPAGHFEGLSLRLYNPETHQWSLNFANLSSGILSQPTIGEFKNGRGEFFDQETLNGRAIFVRFVISDITQNSCRFEQSFSDDGGKTWEVNWIATDTRVKDEAVQPTSNSSKTSKRMNDIATNQNLNSDQNIQVIELRNYVIRPGRRDAFIELFEETFTQSQNILGGYTLGQYTVKGADDHFFWIRGFKDMTARVKFLNDFYRGSPAWKENKSAANSMLVNNDNVYLLKPLNLKDSANDSEYSFNSNWFGQAKGIAVVDFYVSNTKLAKLVEFVKQKYVAILNSAKVAATSFWTSEITPNDFPALPVFQDKNLLVQITFYKDESEYQTRMKSVAAKMNDEMKDEMADLVTIKNTLIIYPTKRSFLLPKP
jgi:hypothetical protein